LQLPPEQVAVPEREPPFDVVPLCDVVHEPPEQLVVREPDQELPFAVVPLWVEEHDPPEQVVVRVPDQELPFAVVPLRFMVQLPPEHDREPLQLEVPRQPVYEPLQLRPQALASAAAATDRMAARIETVTNLAIDSSPQLYSAPSMPAISGNSEEGRPAFVNLHDYCPAG
jgi:hypothetical protein